MKTRTDLLISAHLNEHFCCELPLVLWWDSEGRAHYSIPSPRAQPAPDWMAVATAVLLAVAAGLSAMHFAVDGF